MPLCKFRRLAPGKRVFQTVYQFSKDRKSIRAEKSACFKMRVYKDVLHTLCSTVFLLVIVTQSSLSFTSEGTKQPRTVIPNSPRFIVKLADDSLLCFSIDGFELFTFNLITTSYVVVNGFLNATEVGNIDKSVYTNSTDTPVYIRGFTDLGMLVKAVDSRWKGGKRVFKHTVNGGTKMKAVLDGFGEMDIRKGLVLFGIDKGHSNIESQAAKFETFKLVMDKPVLELVAVSGDQHTFSVYVPNSAGFRTIGIHGLIGQFYSQKVRLSQSMKEFTRADGNKIPVEEQPIWDTVKDGVFDGQQCWYPQEGYSAVEGEPWEYVVEHLHATSFKRTLFK